MAGIQIHFNQHVVRHLGKQIVQFIINDDVVQIPLAVLFRQIRGAEGLILAVWFLIIPVWNLGAVA